MIVLVCAKGRACRNAGQRARRTNIVNVDSGEAIIWFTRPGPRVYGKQGAAKERTKRRKNQSIHTVHGGAVLVVVGQTACCTYSEFPVLRFRFHFENLICAKKSFGKKNYPKQTVPLVD